MTKLKFSSRQALSILAVSACLWPALSNTAFAQFARLYQVTGGEVYLQRPNWSTFYITYPRTMLTGDDLLRVSVGAEVLLLCPDGEPSASVEAGVSNVSATCVGTPRSVRPSFNVSEQWAGADASQPYVISPWSEQVRTARPPLRWNPVESAEQYTITLLQRDGENWNSVWTVTSDQPSIAYPADQPELEFGQEYSLQVAVSSETSGGAENVGEDSISPTVAFRLLDGLDQQLATEDIAEVEAFDVDEITKTLILAEEVYPRYKLFAEGANQLTALIESGTETALIYRLLGDYYIHSGLVLPTASNYLQAIALAQETGNLEEEAMAAWGLGTLYGRTGQTEDACSYLQQARALADELGDSGLIEDIDAEILSMQTRSEDS